MIHRRATILVATLLTGCGFLNPFPGNPHAAKPSQVAAGPRVAICYNPIASSRKTVHADAQRQCGPGTEAHRVATDYYLQYCPVLLPERATFVCAAHKT